MSIFTFKFHCLNPVCSHSQPLHWVHHHLHNHIYANRPLDNRTRILISKHTCLSPKWCISTAPAQEISVKQEFVVFQFFFYGFTLLREIFLSLKLQVPICKQQIKFMFKIRSVFYSSRKKLIMSHTRSLTNTKTFFKLYV